MRAGEMKLVARAGKSPEPQPLEAVVCLQVREAHFNTLPFVSRLGKRLHCAEPQNTCAPNPWALATGQGKVSAALPGSQNLCRQSMHLGLLQQPPAESGDWAWPLIDAAIECR
jgi:hypothetical protein